MNKLIFNQSEPTNYNNDNLIIRFSPKNIILSINELLKLCIQLSPIGFH